MTPPTTELRRPVLERTTAMRLAATEYERVADAIAALSPDDWARPTDCPAWDVRQLCCHVVGMAEMASSMRETMRQRKAAGARLARDGGLCIDALTGSRSTNGSTGRPPTWSPACGRWGRGRRAGGAVRPVSYAVGRCPAPSTSTAPTSSGPSGTCST